MKPVIIYTDGACRGNPGPGGWAAILRYRASEKRLAGGEAATTNNRMELMAAIRALEALHEPCEITLFTDSTYLKKGLTEWLPQWRARNWRTADNKAVKNQDLWQRLEQAATHHRIDWRWVKGHSGNEGNDLVDRLANAAIDDMMGGPSMSASAASLPTSSD